MGILKLFNSTSSRESRFEHLLRPNIEALYRLAFRLCQSQDDAEELVQLYLTRLFQKVNQLEEIDRLTPWLRRGLYNLYVDEYRKSVRANGLFSADEFDEESTGHADTPHRQANIRDLSASIGDALVQLNENQRIVVVLHDSEGYTLDELSEMLEVPVGTLKSRLNRARTELKKMLSMEPLEEVDRVTGTEW